MRFTMPNKNCKEAFTPSNWLIPKTITAKNIDRIIKVILCLKEFAFIINEKTDINNTKSETPHPTTIQHRDIYHFAIVNN